MMEDFEMTDLGKMYYFFSLEVLQYDDGIFVYQMKYVLEILNSHKMKDYNATHTPLEFGVKLHKDKGETGDNTMYR